MLKSQIIIFLEHLLCARYCSKWGGYHVEHGAAPDFSLYRKTDSRQLKLSMLYAMVGISQEELWECRIIIIVHVLGVLAMCQALYTCEFNL